MGEATMVTSSDQDGGDGLQFAVLLDGQGGGQMMDWAAIHQWTPEQGLLWVHLDRTKANTGRWLAQESGMTSTTIDALLSKESRPRTFQGKHGLVAILRGVNLNPGKDLDDMIDLRLWSDGRRLVSLREEHVKSVRDILADLAERQAGPENVSALFSRIVSRLNERIEPSVDDIDQRIEQIEMEENDDLLAVREALQAVRAETMVLRRYLSPQRSALAELASEPPDWADEHWHPRLRESADLALRLIEELDLARERIIAVREDLTAQRAEAMNQAMYVLAVISAIFLPLSFLTGLFGINIGGMPGVDNPWAFAIFCLLLVVLGVGEIWLFRRLRWLS